LTARRSLDAYGLVVTVGVVAALAIWVWPNPVFIIIVLPVLWRACTDLARHVRTGTSLPVPSAGSFRWVLLLFVLFSALLFIRSMIVDRSQLGGALALGMAALAAGVRLLGEKLQGRARAAGIIAFYGLLNLSFVLLAVLVLCP